MLVTLSKNVSLDPCKDHSASNPLNRWKNLRSTSPKDPACFAYVNTDDANRRLATGLITRFGFFRSLVRVSKEFEYTSKGFKGAKCSL